MVEEKRITPIPRPESWTRPFGDGLPRPDNDLRRAVDQIVVDVLFESTAYLSDMVDRGEGREVLGEVAGRADEDVEIGIDKKAEEMEVEILDKAGRAFGLSFLVLSEHDNYTTGSGKPDLILVLDPIENSDEHLKGLSTPPFIVFSIYDLRHNPIAAGASNLVNQHMTLNSDGKNYEYNPKRDKGPIYLPPPPEIKSIKDPRFVIASYDGKYKYSSLFNLYLDFLNQNRSPHSTFHGKSGSHTYVEMAHGAVSEYAIFNEPHGEIDPGYIFALSAGYTVVSVKPDGSFRSYKFNPRLQDAREPFLVVTRTPQLRTETIKYFKQAQKEIESNARLRKEFEVFLASRDAL